MKIYLVRHAESLGNISGKFNGVTDLPLSPKGEKQARLLGQFFNNKKLDKIYTSVLRRTIQTANFSTGWDESSFIKLAELNEINGGHWEGVEWDKIIQRYNDEYVLWNEKPHLVRLPGGESLDELYERSIGVLKRITEENDPDSTIGVFSHGTVLKVWVAYIRNLDLEELPLIAWYENSSVTAINYENGEFSLEFYDNHNHLPMEIKTVANTPWGCNMKETCKY
jgi:probable phosphoglycerate mutase